MLPSATASGVPPASPMLCRLGAHASGDAAPPQRLDVLRRSPRRRPCGSARAAEVAAAHARLRGERDEVRAELVDVAAAQAVASPWPARRSSAPRASRRRGWRAARRRRARRSRTPSAGMSVGRHAVAERDGAGLVEQQHVDVAGRLDRAAAHRDHVLAQQAIHAGDADGREQAADGRRDQADEQRHDHRRRQVDAGVDAPAAPASRRRTGRRWSARRAGCAARSRSASSAAPRPRPARSCGRGTTRPDRR